MIARLALPLLLLLAACGGDPTGGVDRRAPSSGALPAMKVFSDRPAPPPARANRTIARDILDLVFRLESGAVLPTFTRFEGPVTVRVTGPAPPTLRPDLTRLIGRLRREAGIDIRPAAADAPASITIDVVARRELQRFLPDAACVVVPNVVSWRDYVANRRSRVIEWGRVRARTQVAVIIPGDTSPQEIRTCLHEEIAQALGPVNDMFRLTDSVFNDDDFHSVLTGFDMTVLRAVYAPELQTGMTRAEVGARLPAILARINPAGERTGAGYRRATPDGWRDQILTALDGRKSRDRRIDAATRAVGLARPLGPRDPHLAYALYLYGRLTLSSEPDVALAAFLRAGDIYRADRGTRLQAANVALQVAGFALSDGQPGIALEIADDAIPVAARAENAALLSLLMLVKAEALALQGRAAPAAAVRRDALGWARYGFGAEEAVRARAAEISGLAPQPRPREGGV